MAIGGLISNRNSGSLIGSGVLCVLPWLTMAVFANVGGWIADTLVSRGLSITAVRKIMQSIGFLGPAIFLAQLSHVRTPAMAVLCMACSQVYWRNTAFDLLGYPSRFDEDLILQAVTIQEHALYIPCLSSKYQVECY
ncbi:ascorbate transporter, chloroplastic-like isoform X3 [Populus nigra]|uniref:ascorbate transporter, chloroplastic-like isoform X3 n=1 Tax=Populus nigra TaxID=3691 RepID=UPI002B26E174|nr:ascorbate transporter, chloroplastic-like isoform X3 [Populus nigra]